MDESLVWIPSLLVVLVYPMNDRKVNLCCRGWFLLEEFPRVEDAVRVEGIFDRLVSVERDFAERFAQPAFFRQANAVFASDRTVVVEHPGEEFVEGVVRAFVHDGVIVVTDH